MAPERRPNLQVDHGNLLGSRMLRVPNGGKPSGETDILVSQWIDEIPIHQGEN
jgi:hypothetical protein